MIRNLSLMVKFLGGFAVIIMLLVSLSYVGYSGLSGVAGHADLTETVNTLAANITRARQFEQQFTISHDNANINKVFSALDLMKRQVEAAKKTYPDKNIQHHLDAMQEKAGHYENAFKTFVELDAFQNKKMETMEQKAKAALTLTSDIRNNEKKQLDEIRETSEIEIADKLVKVDAANQIYNTVLEARVHRVSLMNRNDLSTMAQWNGSNKKLEAQVKGLESKFKTPENKKLISQILKKKKSYIDAVLLYLETGQYEDLNKLIKAVKDYTFSITALQFDMKEQLEFYQEDTKILIDEKLAITETVNKIASLLLGARMQEKAMIISRDTEKAASISTAMKAVYDTASVFEENMENEDLVNRVKPIISSIKEYEQSFTAYVDLVNQQHMAAKQMVAAAREVEQVSTGAIKQMRESMAGQISRGNLIMLVGTLVAVAVGILCLVACAVVIVRPVRRTADMLKDIAGGEGDLTKRMVVASSDEVGDMAVWFNAFVSKLNDIVKNISESFETVSASSNKLLVISQGLDEGVGDVRGKSVSVATAAEELSSNMNSVAAASEQAATNVGFVAQAIDNLNSTVSEIEDNSEQARSITNNAVSEAKNALKKVNNLGSAAEKINKVTEVIAEISDQTNLLALNATIEAARAGEAGKGFAVVANEIKDLARQTAEATKDIKQQIDGIQVSTGETVNEISNITKVIDSVNEIVNTIAAAVQEQSKSTGEISGNVSQALSGIKEVNENVAQSSIVSGEIAEDITRVSQISESIADGSGEVNVNAKELDRLSSELKQMIGVFKVDKSDCDDG